MKSKNEEIAQTICLRDSHDTTREYRNIVDELDKKDKQRIIEHDELLEACKEAEAYIRLKTQGESGIVHKKLVQAIKQVEEEG